MGRRRRHHGAELSGPTRRHGPEGEVSWRLHEYVRADFAFTRSFGRFRGSGKPIPRAPRWTYAAHVSFDHPRGLAGSFRVGGLSQFPLDEEGQFEGDAYHIADLNLTYRLTPHWSLLASFENLLDANFKEAQTFFFSRLPFEPVPVGDNHFNPGTPFTFRLGLQFNFDF